MGLTYFFKFYLPTIAGSVDSEDRSVSIRLYVLCFIRSMDSRVETVKVDNCNL